MLLLIASMASQRLIMKVTTVNSLVTSKPSLLSAAVMNIISMLWKSFQETSESINLWKETLPH